MNPEIPSTSSSYLSSGLNAFNHTQSCDDPRSKQTQAYLPVDSGVVVDTVSNLQRFVVPEVLSGTDLLALQLLREIACDIGDFHWSGNKGICE